MAPKKADGAAATTSSAPKAKSTHASYQDMITDAILALKDRTGSSRQSLKKYVKANNTITATDNMFDSLFNKALKAGVDKGVFEQPKGPSGTTKLSKKSKPVVKPAPKKEGDKEVKKAAPKKEKEGAKKATTTTKKPAAKKEKEAGEKKPAAKKAAAATPKKAAPKKAPAAKKEAPAVVDKPAALTKTKSGRVAKTSTKPAAKKAAAPKKAAPKKEKASKKETKTETPA
ncbi:linker histone H1 and H5 family-domain-containing protein [Xylaria digitata]|nr:linker histone H1 and H5 family-domain-containing protein [Xylaria digitata]